MPRLETVTRLSEWELVVEGVRRGEGRSAKRD